MKPQQNDWRALYTRWQPYAIVLVLAALHTRFPAIAYTLLAIIHWAALDVLRAGPPVQIDGITEQANTIEDKQRFVGNDVGITSNRIYKVGTRHYLVQVQRAEKDLEGRELA